MELLANATGVRLVLAHLDELGVDAQSLAAGYIDPDLRRLSGPLKVSARLEMDLLEAAAERLRQPDFGLRHALWLNLRGLDSISLLWDQAGSVAEWYSLASKYVHLENNAVSYALAEEGPDVALAHDIIAMLRPRAVQASYTFLALSARVFRNVLGAKWAPVRVEFVAPRPLDISLFREFFRCRIEFGAARDALVVTREDFERPLDRHNPEMVRFLEARMRHQSASGERALEDTVLAVLRSELAGGPPSLPQIARRLALTPRTLQRRLAQAGTAYGTLLAQTRIDVATAHLERPARTPLSRLAHELGLSDATAASRFLRQHTLSVHRPDRTARKSTLA